MYTYACTFQIYFCFLSNIWLHNSNLFKFLRGFSICLALKSIRNKCKFLTVSILLRVITKVALVHWLEYEENHIEFQHVVLKYQAWYNFLYYSYIITQGITFNHSEKCLKAGIREESCSGRDIQNILRMMIT